MNKKSLLSSIIVVLALPCLALAADPTSALDVIGILSRVTGYLWQIFAALTVLAFIYAGILYVWGSYDSSKVSQAKQVVIYAVIGMCIVLLGYSVKKIIKEILGVL